MSFLCIKFDRINAGFNIIHADTGICKGVIQVEQV